MKDLQLFDVSETSQLPCDADFEVFECAAYSPSRCRSVRVIAVAAHDRFRTPVRHSLTVATIPAGDEEAEVFERRE